MELVKGLHVIDNVLSSEQLMEFRELLISHTYKDNLDFYSFYMPDMAANYRIFKNNGSVVSNSKNLAKSGYSSVSAIVESAREAYGYSTEIPLTCQLTIMPNGSKYNLHIDSSYFGAFIFYFNEEWSIENEGELVCYPHLEVEHEDFLKSNFGSPIRQERFQNNFGLSIAPIHNRLVCIPSGMPHRVTQSQLYKGIGRASLSGFFNEK